MLSKHYIVDMIKIPEYELREMEWKDISIINDADGNKMLILICEDNITKIKLYHALSTKIYRTLIFIEEDKTYTISIEFELADRAIKVNTGLTSVAYPPLIDLNTGNVNKITAGVWVTYPTESNYYKPLLPFVPKMNNN